MLEYVLEDFLELKTSLDTGRTKSLKEFLFSRSVGDGHIASLEGFLLAQSLVVFGETNLDVVEHLVFLNPEDGQIQIKRL